MAKNFQLPGRPSKSVKGKPLPRKAADAGWVVPGVQRRGDEPAELEEFTLSYDGDDITYNGLKLTYSKPAQ